jgi:hypothetical protein
MAFMGAYIEPFSGYMVELDGNTEFLAEDECPFCGSDFEGEDECPNCGAEVVDKFDGFAGGLSAPGYMDQTEPVYGETKAEVAQELLDMYFDQEDMDDEELADMEWLEGVAAGNE